MVDPAARFRSEVLRTADRLRGLGVPRLTRDDPSGAGAVADRAYALAADIVAATAAAGGVESPALPRLEAHGAGDQLAVVGLELAELAEAGDVSASVLDDLSSRLLELRRST